MKYLIFFLFLTANLFAQDIYTNVKVLGNVRCWELSEQTMRGVEGFTGSETNLEWSSNLYHSVTDLTGNYSTSILGSDLTDCPEDLVFGESGVELGLVSSETPPTGSYTSYQRAIGSGVSDAFSNITVMCWVKYKSSGTKNSATMVSNRNLANGSFLFYHNSSGLVAVNLSGKFVTGDTFNYSADTWYHYVFTYNGATQDGYMYRDGVEIGNNLNMGVSGGVIAASNFQYVFGGERAATGLINNNTLMLMRNCGIYNTDLADTEVLALYNQQSPETTPTPLYSDTEVVFNNMNSPYVHFICTGSLTYDGVLTREANTTDYFTSGDGSVCFPTTDNDGERRQEKTILIYGDVHVNGNIVETGDLIE